MTEPRPHATSNQILSHVIPTNNSNSLPRPTLNYNHLCSFYPGLREDDFSQIGSFQHNGINRIDVDVDSLMTTILHRKLKINMDGIPFIQKKRNDPSKFAKYRNIFKVFGRTLRQLDFNDQGVINANILKDHLNLNSEDNLFVEAQGGILYKIISDIANNNIYNPDEIEQMLQPIVASYEERYGCRLFTESNDDQNISDDIKDDFSWDLFIPRKEPFTENDLLNLLENIDDKFVKGEEEEDLNDSDEDDKGFCVDDSMIFYLTIPMCLAYNNQVLYSLVFYLHYLTNQYHHLMSHFHY